MEKINVYNKSEMSLDGIAAKTTLFYTDKLLEFNDTKGVYLYAESTDGFLHSQGCMLAAVTKIAFGDAILPLVVYDTALTMLPKDVQTFFLLHEVGHVKNKDIDIPETQSRKLIVKRMFGILPEMEVLADKYAASIVGIDKAKEAFMFMIKNTNLPLTTKIEMLRRYFRLTK